MRKITPPQITSFLLMLSIIITAAITTSLLITGNIPLGDFKAIALVAFTIILIYLYAFIVYRIFLAIMPLSEGELLPGSRAEFAAQVNILFYLMLFNSLIRTHFVPVPIMRLVYLALGARLGKDTYSAGALLDPPLIRIGDNSIVGHDAALFAHAIEGNQFSLERIEIGNNVTIGAHAIVMAGVKIGDNAIISAGAIVKKGAQIGSNEIWGGIPAKFIRNQ